MRKPSRGKVRNARPGVQPRPAPRSALTSAMTQAARPSNQAPLPTNVVSMAAIDADVKEYVKANISNRVVIVPVLTLLGHSRASPYNHCIGRGCPQRLSL